jgi:dihydrofolate reductase
MSELIINANVSLDGVVQDPAGDEGFNRGGWVGRIAALPDIAKLALDEALAAEALVLGRRSYEWFAGRWPARTGELADRLNTMPKYVVSSTLDELAWNNSTRLDGDAVAGVSQLKAATDGALLVLASFRLVHALLEHDLVDEVRLKVFPVVLGDGDRLFGATSDTHPLRLVDAQTVGDGVLYLTYRADRA